MCVLCYNPALVVGDATLIGGPIIGATIHRIRAVTRRRVSHSVERAAYRPGIPGGGARDNATAAKRPARAAEVIAR
jgi:hypothetical protein